MKQTVKKDEEASVELYTKIATVLDDARQYLAKSVNFAMVQAYWNVGRLIVEDEQVGSHNAQWGKKIIPELSKRLICEFGEGFTVTNLKYMRQFYIAFPIGHALRDQLSWTHYRHLLKVQDETARAFYKGYCNSFTAI